MMCIALTVALLGCTALAETDISAADALFGDGVYDPQAAMTPEGSASDSSSGSGEGTDSDMYGANDTASATSYPTLRLGDYDTADGVAYVVFLQNRLAELGYLDDQPDGSYTETTQNAVREFQSRNSLQATGIADPETQAKLYGDITTLVRYTVDENLFNDDVTRVQSALSQWGFMFNKVDGQMGDNTRACIKSFKEYMKTVDPSFGSTPTPAPSPTPVVDISTAFGDMPVAMDELLDNGNPIVIKADGSIDDAVLAYVDGHKPFRVYRQTVQKGDTGPEVLRVQKRLKALKYVYSADGAFGDVTALGLKYFQRKHGLPETGIADQATQEALFSNTAMPSEEYVFPYKIIVDISDQRVYIGSWNGSAYHDLVKKMKCSTGKDNTPTPTGTYQADGKAGDEWYYFKDFNCYARWATRIVGGILFHSITYNSRKRPSGSTRTLGRKASHGCIRLTVEDAKWIYDNCPAGTTVVIQN